MSEVEFVEFAGAAGIELWAYADQGRTAEVPAVLLATLLPGEEVRRGVALHGRVRVTGPPGAFQQPEWGVIVNHLRDTGHRVTVDLV